MPDLSALGSLNTLSVGLNQFTFADIEPNVGVATSYTYAPQDSVGIAIDTTLVPGASMDLTVTVGGDNTSYQWSKDGAAEIRTRGNQELDTRN